MGCNITPCLEGLIDTVKQQALDLCQVDYSFPEPDAGDSGECRPAVMCDLDAAFNCADTLAQDDDQSNLCT